MAKQESDFGARLRLVRCWMDINQDEMAEKLFCSAATIGAYERLERFPSTKQVKEIAQILGVPFLWLCGMGPTFAWEVGYNPTEAK